MNVAGKVALITGGATGVGHATALALARLGCSVAVNHIAATTDAAARTVAELTALGVRALAVEADVTQNEACHAMVATVLRALGRIDILINCAGVTRFIPHASLDAVTDADWDRIFGVNLKGTFHAARAARAALAENGGVIINIASTAGILGGGSSIPYAASKAAVINLTVNLARVLAPRIRVNAVAPGFIEGDWMRAGLGERYDTSRDAWAAASALGRVCQPEDVATAILSLITGSDLVTGHTLVCDGGALLSDPASRGLRQQ